MHNELQAMELNKTWSMVPLPKGKHSIECKWVYKVKLKTDGNVEWYKGRLIVKGYNQQEGLDYFETFSLVAQLVIVKIFLSLAYAHSWFIVQLEMIYSFLHRNLFEEVYIDLPCYTPQTAAAGQGKHVVRKLHM